jgi:hypothetical protein
MPRYSISYPCKVVTSELLPSFSSVVMAASKEDSEIVVGVQDVGNSDLNVVDFLSEQPYTRIADTSASVNLSGTLNKIIASSQGQYLIRTDSDDFMHPLRISELRKAIERHGSFSILGQAYRAFRGRELGPLIISSADSIANKLQLLLGVPFAHPAITLDLAKIGLGPYDETQTYAQDYMLYVDKINTGNYIGDPTIATYYNSPLLNSKEQESKRKKQLEDHERAMLKMWQKIECVSISKEDIHQIRCSLVTKEHSSTRKTNDREKYINKFLEVRQLLKTMLEIKQLT